MVCMLVVQIQLEVGCTACTTVNIDCPYPSQMPLVVWISFVPHGQSLLLCSAVPILLCGCTGGQAGPMWALSVRVQALEDRGYFWCTAPASTSNDCPLPSQMPLLSCCCFSWPDSFLGFGSPPSSVKLWFEVSALTLPKLRHVLELSWEISHETCVVPVLQPTIFPVSNARTGALSVWLAPLVPHWGCLSLNLFLWVSSLRHRPCLIFFFLPFIPDSVWIFLSALAIQESFCQYPVIFLQELFYL